MTADQRANENPDDIIRLPEDPQVRDDLRRRDIARETDDDYEAVVLRQLVARTQVTRSEVAAVLAEVFGSVDMPRLDSAWNRMRVLTRTPEEDAVRRIPDAQLSADHARAQEQLGRMERKMEEGAPDPAVLPVWRAHLRQARALLMERVRRDPKLSPGRDLARITALERRLDGADRSAGIPASVRAPSPAAPSTPARARPDVSRSPDYSRISVAYQGLHGIGEMLRSAEDYVAELSRRLDARPGLLGKVAGFFRGAAEPDSADLVRRLQERDTEKYRAEILALVLERRGEVTREDALQALSRTRVVNAQEFDKVWKEIVSSIWSSNIPGETSGL